MPDLQRALISKVIAQSDMVTPLSAGIKSDWFEDELHHRVYRWCVEYFQSYGEAPTPRALKAEFPTYRLLRVPEPFEYYVDKLRAQRRRAILVEGVVEADEELRRNDSKRAQAKLSGALMRLGREINNLTDTNAVRRFKTRYDHYVESQGTAGKVTGIATGFPTLDFLTGGFHPQQFVIYGGEPKQGKSFLLLLSAIAAQEQGKKVLFLSFEMSMREQLNRYDAITCGVNANRILHGALSDEDLKKLWVGMRQRKNMTPFVISSDISATTTVSGLAAKIEEHQPDIIFIDGVYLMENEDGAEPQSAQAYTSISRGLKRLAQRINKPIVVSHQALSSKIARDRAVTLYSLGWSSAWSQDADLILGIEKDRDGPFITLRVVAGRNVSPAEITVHANWDESFIEECDRGDDEE